MSNLYVSAEQQRVVSVTPDCFKAMLILNSAENGMGKVDYETSLINSRSCPSHHNVEVSCESINAANAVICCGNAWESNDSNRFNTKSICGVKPNRIDLNPNERKKKLAFADMNLCCSTIPMKELCGTPLGGTLQRLSLASNPLREVPPELVVRLPALQILDLSRCQLHQLPQKFQLPNLKVLNLQNNELTEFPNEVCKKCIIYFILLFS